MKYFEWKTRLIARLVVLCFFAVVGSQVAKAQVPRTPPESGPFPPTSGALLTISGTAGSAVNIAIYDSQIHSGTVQVPPSGTGTSNCNSGDLVPTDAYVLQGGSATGCDPGDAFEVTEVKNPSTGSIVNISAASQSASNTTYCYTLTSGPDLQASEKILIAGIANGNDNGTFTITVVTPVDTPNCDDGASFTVVNAAGVTLGSQSGTGTVANGSNPNPHQQPGKADVSGFHIETHYPCAGACSGGVTGTGGMCNTSGTICTAAGGPDSGFLTVTNNTDSAFTGTITLQGNSPIAGDPFCPVNGVAFDTWSAGLAAGASVTLALGSEGSTELPKGADTSNCGGFNAPQTQTLVAGQTAVFAFGNDAYKFTPQNSNVGDQLTFLPVPVPAGPLGLDSWALNAFGLQAPENPVASSPLRFSATNYPGQACIPISDFSALTNPVCPEIQLSCTSTSEVSDCTTFLYSFEYDFAIDKNSLPGGVGGVNYVADQVDQCPTTGFNMDNFLSYTATAPDPIRGPGNPIGCFAAIFNPTTAPVPVGQTVTQHTFKGFFFPVIDSTPNHVFFNQIDPGSVVSLIWQTEDSSGKPVPNLHLCNNLTGAGCVKPWVTLESLDVGCPNAPLPGPAPSPTLDASFFNTGLLRLGNGFYAFLWQTPRSSPVGSCVTPVLVFSTGFISFDVANFQFER